MGVSKYGAIKSDPVIMPKLSNTGVKAGIKNFLCVFKIPAANETKEIKPI